MEFLDDYDEFTKQGNCILKHFETIEAISTTLKNSRIFDV
jgi:hypothetical protein